MKSNPVTLVFLISMLVLGLVPGCSRPSAPPANVDGWWRSSFGMLILEQDGQRVEGTYTWGGGTLQGKISGRRLELHWQDSISGRGWVRFTVKEDGLEMRGPWGVKGHKKAAGQWNATRWQHLEYSGTPSYWRIQGTSAGFGQLSGNAVLYEEDGRISGELQGTYLLPGARSPTSLQVHNRITGRRSAEGGLALTWEDLTTSVEGPMNLQGGTSQLSGSWLSNDGSRGGDITFVRLQDPSAQEPDLSGIVEDSGALNVARQRLLKGEELLREQRPAQAREQFKLVLEEIPRDNLPDLYARALFGRGTCLRQLELHDEADQVFAEILALDVHSSWHLMAQTALDWANP